MSMTPEQALKLLEYPIYKWSMDWDEREDGMDYTEAIEIAIAALDTPNEPLTCEGCKFEYETTDEAMCEQCIRSPAYRDYYRRPPEGEA